VRRSLGANRGRGRLGAAGFVTALTISMAFGNVPNYAVGLIAPFWQSDLGLSAVQVGAVATAVALVATAGSLFAGWLVDARGGQPLLLALFALVAISLSVMAAAPSVLLLLAGAGIGGAAQAIANPATNQLTATYLHPEGRGSSVGIKQSGVQAGGFVMGLLFPSAAAGAGWRSVLAATAVASVVAGMITLALTLSRPLAPTDLTAPVRGGERDGSNSVAWLATASFFVGAGAIAVLSYTPLYAVSLGESPRVGGLIVALSALAGVAGRIVWATVAERTPDVSRVLAVLGLVAVVSAAIMPLSSAVGVSVLWVAGVLNGVSAGAWNAPMMVAVIKALPRRSIGRGTGAVQTAFLAGLVTSPIAIGWTADSMGGYDLGWGIVAAAFACATISAWRWGVASGGGGRARRARRISTIFRIR